MAYYQLNSKLATVYETVSLKKFYHGRTAVCRAATETTTDFLKTFSELVHDSKLETLDLKDYFANDTAKTTLLNKFKMEYRGFPYSTGFYEINQNF